MSRRLACAVGAAVVAGGTVVGPATVRASDAWWAADKARHYQVSAGLAAGTYIAIRPVAARPSRRALLAFSLAVAAGAGKELVDAAGAGDPSLKDMAWNAAGALTGALVAWLFDEGLTTRQDVAGSAPMPPRLASPPTTRWLVSYAQTQERDEALALAALLDHLDRRALAQLATASQPD